MNRRPRLPYLAAVLAALSVLLVIGIIDRSERARHAQEARGGAVRHASVLRAKLEGALNQRLHLTYGLGALVRVQDFIDPVDFRLFAEGLAQSGIRGIRSLQLAPKGVVTYVHPLAGNEAVVGHDLLADPERAEAVRRAIEQRLFVVAGPLRLIQGGIGLIARLPLFAPDHQEVERFWGFATIVLDIDAILAEAGLGAPGDPFRVALRGRDALGEAGEVFYGEASTFAADPVLLEVSLPHGGWQLAVMPNAGWPLFGPTSAIIWAGGAMMAALAAALALVLTRAPERLRREVVRATAALRESEAMFRSVAESATDAMVSAEVGGRIVFWNPAAERMFGWLAEEMVGRRLDTLDLHPDPEGDTDRGAVIAMQGRRRDGEAIPLELTFSRWQAGGVEFETAIIRDVSELRRANRERDRLKEQYHQAQKLEAVGTLASGAAHEFNNILNSLIAHAETAAAVVPAEGPARNSLDQVLTASWRAAEIVAQLLAFSERAGGSREPVPMRRVVDDVVAELRCAGLPATIAVEAALDGSEGLVHAEQGQVRQLVAALCANAVEAMGVKGGRLSLALREVTLDAVDDACGQRPHCQLASGQPGAGVYVGLDVADTGCGMDEALMRRIFEPFFTTKGLAGKGMGLAVVHGIVRNLGGAICVASQPGTGSRFTVLLPLYQQPSSGERAAA